MPVDPEHIVVIGGGVIGTACAHYLQQQGYKVTILEKGEHGRACSHANCGLISPSHVQPLAVPGAISKTFKLMMKKNSPFKIGLKWSPGLWWWLMKFATKCNEKEMLHGSLILHNLLTSSRELYDELVDQQNLHCEFERQGCLSVYKTQKEFESFGKTNDLLKKEFGVEAACWNQKTLLEKEPALKEDLQGGWFYEIDAHLRPDRLMTSWRNLLKSRGVNIVEKCEFHGFHSESQKAKAALTSCGEFAADMFVTATGAWTPFLSEAVGMKVPIQPGKGYSMTMPRPSICPKHSMLLPEVKVAVTPFQSGYRLGSTMEFSGYDTSVNKKRLQSLKEGAEQFLKVPHAVPVEEEWYGWRPMTYDSLPVIDYSPRLNNVLIAAGHNMLGLSLAPVTGKLIAELISNKQPHVDIKGLSVNRFK